MKLHLGCSKRNFGPDWIHIDGSGNKMGGDDRISGDFKHIKYHNITKLPFGDNTCDIIYSSHTIEYFDREEIKNILKEWKRVLKKGGILRLAVPNFEMIVKLYHDKIWTLEQTLGSIYGKWKVNDNYINYHKTAFDYNSIKKVLIDSDFKNIRKWDWRKVEHGHIDDYSQSHWPHMDKKNGILVSLNIECTK